MALITALFLIASWFLNIINVIRPVSPTRDTRFCFYKSSSYWSLFSDPYFACWFPLRLGLCISRDLVTINTTSFVHDLPQRTNVRAVIYRFPDLQCPGNGSSISWSTCAFIWLRNPLDYQQHASTPSESPLLQYGILVTCKPCTYLRLELDHCASKSAQQRPSPFWISDTQRPPSIW
jgi:hypothetical protein